jgi:hypothetical protein
MDFNNELNAEWYSNVLKDASTNFENAYFENAFPGP